MTTKEFLRHISLFLLVTMFAPCIHVNASQIAKSPPARPHELMLTAEEEAWLKVHPVIRVGYDPSYPPFEFINDAEEHDGIAADYLKLLEKKLGITFEVVKGLSWKQALEGTRSGVLDLLPVATDTPERREYLKFTDKYLFYQQVFITRSDSPPLKGFADLEGKTLAVSEGYPEVVEIKRRFPTINQLVVQNPLEELEAVSMGQADACQGSLAVFNYLIQKHNLLNLKVAARSDAEGAGALGMGVRKDWPLLYSIIQKALKSVTEKERIAISRKWVPFELEGEFVQQLVLTVAEKRWLAEHPVIRVASDASWAPIEFVGKDGNYTGLSIDYLKNIESMLGIRFEFVRKSWQELIALAKQKQVDLFTCVASTPEREKYLLFTEPYIQMPAGIFTGEEAAYITDLNKIAGKKIAVVEGYAIHDYLTANHPDLDLLLVKTPEEGIRSIKEKKAFGYIDNIITTGHLISRKGYLSIKLAGEAPFVYAQRMGIRKDWPQLRDILQKAISTIPEAEQNAIYNQWVPITYEKPIDQSLFWKIGAAIFCLISLILIWNRKLKSEVDRKTAEITLNEERLEALWGISRKEELTGRELALYALEQAVRLTGSSGGYFHFYDEPTETISLNVWTKDVMKRCETTERGHYPLERAGIWADAIRQRGPVIHNEYQTMPNKKGTPEGHFPLLRHMSIPILFENRIIAIAGVANKKLPYDDKDARQLSLLMTDAWQIVKRRESEEERKKIDAQFRSFMSYFPAFIYIKNDNLEHVFGNRLTQELAKKTLKDFAGTTSHDLFPDDIARKQEESDRLVLEEQRSLDMEYPIISKTGDMTWIKDIKFPIAIPGGEKLLGGIAFDITEQKKSFNKLKESEKNYREIFNSASDAIMLVNIKNGQLVDCNRKALEMFKCSRKEFIGKTPDEISPPRQPDGSNSQEKVQEIIPKLLIQQSLAFEWQHMRLDGEVFDTEISVSLIEVESERFAQAIVRDISERKRFEKEKEKLESQLRQAQKMEAIGTLAGGIAHDFNNILSAIFGYSELAKDDADNPQMVLNDLDEVLKGANRAKDLVKQILTFSRRSEQELQPLKVELVVKEALKLLRSSIPTTIAIKEDISRDCEAVLADPTQVHQVVMNLCTNAYHAMKESGGTLAVTLYPVLLTTDALAHKINLDPGSYLKLEISDTGCGISKINQERIFEPYFTTKPQGEGTGLGLAVVHGIVRSIRGEISVYSEPNRGTTFQVYLPVIKSTQSVAEEKETAPLPTGSERILLVDDDQALVRVQQSVLERLGYTVTAMTSSPLALDEFSKAPDDFDLLITDMTMPDLTGADLTRQILAIRPEFPIILCTGFSELIDAEKAQEIGIRDYIMKPAIRMDLATVIRKVLDTS